MPWIPEAVGRPDGVSVLLQLALVAGLATWLRGPLPNASSARLPHPLLATALAVLLIGAGTAFGLTGEGHAHAAGPDIEAMHTHDGDASAPTTDIHDELHQADEADKADGADKASEADAAPHPDAADAATGDETPAVDARAPGDADHTH